MLQTVRSGFRNYSKLSDSTVIAIIAKIWFFKNYENRQLYFSALFRWWKMFAKSIDTSKFWHITVAFFEISNPESLGPMKIFMKKIYLAFLRQRDDRYKCYDLCKSLYQCRSLSTKYDHQTWIHSCHPFQKRSSSRPKYGLLHSLNNLQVEKQMGGFRDSTNLKTKSYSKRWVWDHLIS